DHLRLREQCAEPDCSAGDDRRIGATVVGEELERGSWSLMRLGDPLFLNQTENLQRFRSSSFLSGATLIFKINLKLELLALASSLEPVLHGFLVMGVQLLIQVSRLHQQFVKKVAAARGVARLPHQATHL